jgi:hypothetical protein
MSKEPLTVTLFQNVLPKMVMNPVFQYFVILLCFGYWATAGHNLMNYSLPGLKNVFPHNILKM